MKKYIIPTIEVIELDTEDVVATFTSSTVGIDTNTTVESGAAPSRRRGDAWSEYDGIE
jgi:hypothetical protein